jgi:hypothetical protein
MSWIRRIVLGGSVSVLANGEESNTFKTGKGLRQGDPLVRGPSLSQSNHKT